MQFNRVKWTAMALKSCKGDKTIRGLRAQASPVYIGRGDQQEIDVHASRKHCSLELLNQGGHDEVVRLVSLSKVNSTNIFRSGIQEPTILNEGQQAFLKHNDRFSIGAGLEHFVVDLRRPAAESKPALAARLCQNVSKQQHQPLQQQPNLCAQQLPHHDVSVELNHFAQQPSQQDVSFHDHHYHQQQQEQQQPGLFAQQHDGSLQGQEVGQNNLQPKHHRTEDGGLLHAKRRRAGGAGGDVGGFGMTAAGGFNSSTAVSFTFSASGPGGVGTSVPVGVSARAVARPHMQQCGHSAALSAGLEGAAGGQGVAGRSIQQPAGRSAMVIGNVAAGQGVASQGPRESPASTSQASTGAPIMLILSGINGSGKSTFSKALVQNAQSQFVSVNQDTISSKGTPGSRKQCVTAAQRVLQSGKSVIIDRCNLNVDQRKDFINVAKQFKAPVYGIVLDLPYEVCLTRAVSRVDHPSGKQGQQWVRIVCAMQHDKEQGSPPSVDEGVQGVAFCTSDQEVAATLQAWQSYRLGGGYPPGMPSMPVQRELTAQQPIKQHQHQQPHQHALQQSLLLQQQQQSQQQPQQQQPQSTLQHAPQLPPASPGSNPITAHTRATQNAGGGSKGKSKAAPPSASAASVNLMRSLFSLPKAPTKREAGTSDAAAAAAAASLPGGQPSPPQALIPKTNLEPTADTPVPAPHLNLRAAADTPAPVSSSSVGAHARPTFQFGRHQQALYNMARDPDRYIDQDAQGDAYVDAQCIRVRDIYPKGLYHGLVVAREPGLESLYDLQPRHLPLLAHMHKVAMQYVWQCQQQQPQQPLVFRLGFHMVPSCRQLHMHIVSQDLLGSYMKKRDHYQKFTTPFFITLSEVEHQLREQGRVSFDASLAERYLKAPLKCHRCNMSKPNFPHIQEHLRSCTEAYAGPTAVRASQAAAPQ